MSTEVIGRGQPRRTRAERKAAMEKLGKRQQQWQKLQKKLAQRGKISASSEKQVTSRPAASSDLRSGRW